jgi:hypothetical protein
VRARRADISAEMWHSTYSSWTVVAGRGKVIPAKCILADNCFGLFFLNLDSGYLWRSLFDLGLLLLLLGIFYCLLVW